MRRFLTTFSLAASLVTWSDGIAAADQAWSEKNIEILRSLWIGSLPRLARDPSNSVGDSPEAAKLGHLIFFDTRFSGDGTIACVTCHEPDRHFTDGIAVARGMGTTSRNTPTIVGTAYNPWFFWDGRADSQWSQALQPMEASTEHGGARTNFARILYSDPTYRRLYEVVFGAMPDVSDKRRFPPRAAPIDTGTSAKKWDAMTAADRKLITKIFTNIGKVLAAYERLILPGPSRFDRYVEGLLKGGDAPDKQILTDNEIAGLRLFVGRGKCIQCHNGPLLTNTEFHNSGLLLQQDNPEDEGRARGAVAVRQSEFNCLGAYSDAQAEDCSELDFIKFEGPDLPGSFKTPTLRNVGLTAPYMHDGRFSSLDAVLDHYNQAPGTSIGKTDLLPLALSPEQLGQLRDFLLTLDGPIDVPPDYLSPPNGRP